MKIGDEFYLEEYYTNEEKWWISGAMYYKKTKHCQNLGVKNIIQAQKGKPFKVSYMVTPWDADVNESDNLIIKKISRITTEEKIESIVKKIESNVKHRKELEESLKHLLDSEEMNFWCRYKNVKDYYKKFKDSKYSHYEDYKDLYEVLKTDEEWQQEVIEKYRLENRITYEGVTLENMTIARLYASKDFSQEEFNKAIERQRELRLNNSEYIEFCNFCIENGITYKGVTPKNKELAKLCTKNKVSQEQFYTACCESEGEITEEYLQIYEFCLRNGITYKGVTNKNKELAKFFNDYGINQHYFNKAICFRQEALESGIPEHVLGEEIKEEPALLNIEEIREQTRKEIKNVGVMLQEDFNEQFSYEWLRKNDPHNYIIGKFCDSLVSITTPTSCPYNNDVRKERQGILAEKSILLSDVQNLVVRNSQGDIIAYGTVYINKEHGYAVIDGFNVNKRYKR